MARSLLFYFDPDAREVMIGGEGGGDDEIDVGRRAPGVLEGRLGRLQAQGHASDAVLGVAAGPDTGALDDPIVRRVHDFFQVEVGDDLGREVAAGSGDDRSNAHVLNLT